VTQRETDGDRERHRESVAERVWQRETQRDTERDRERDCDVHQAMQSRSNVLHCIEEKGISVASALAVDMRSFPPPDCICIEVNAMQKCNQG
jgi:hypothetical protein